MTAKHITLYTTYEALMEALKADKFPQAEQVLAAAAGYDKTMEKGRNDDTKKSE